RPTSSRSLCFPETRKHFCVFTARLYGRLPVPRKTSLNWFIPAFVKSRVGSFFGTRESLRPISCPRSAKNCRNSVRISSDVLLVLIVWICDQAIGKQAEAAKK